MRIRKRRLKFTRDGKYFVGLTLAIGFAAINTGNNLLYLVLGMMLSLIISSGVLSEASLRGVIARRRPPERIFANRPFLMEVALKNRKQRLPSFSMEVEDQAAGAPLDRRCYFLKVPPGKEQKTSYRHTFARRGAYRFDGLHLRTRFPFGLFVKSRYLSQEQQVLVYPEIVPVSPSADALAAGGHREALHLGRHGDYHALRSYTTDDDPRDIHWRKSAQVGQLLVKQLEQPSGELVVITLDNLQQGADPGEELLQRQEHAVSQAASFAAHFIRAGYDVGLITRGAQSPVGRGEQHLTCLLKLLALLEFTREELPFATPPVNAMQLFVESSGGARWTRARAA